jgi:phenylalanyl-tRNA synthetase alpha chain
MPADPAVELDRELDLAAARAEIEAAGSLDDLDALRRRLTGKGSAVARVKQSIKDRPAEEKPVVGKVVSEFTAAVTEALEQRQAALAPDAGAGPALDLTMGGHDRSRGHLHLVTQCQRELEDVFVSLGYQVSEGPEVEDDWHNFEALNFPPGHPARAMQDTLYVNLGEPEQVLLRTHTSPVQIRLMETQPPPIYAVIPGRTYRNETLDARHSPVFHQIEGLVVDRGITFGDLAGTLEAFTSAYFGKAVKSRLLPSFFPFTEPSAEFAFSCVFCDGAGCRVCSKTGWVELGGCGMVDPNVFTAVGIDPELYTGFAFGFGLERMAMLRYGVEPIKTFFDNDIRFLTQY